MANIKVHTIQPRFVRAAPAGWGFVSDLFKWATDPALPRYGSSMRDMYLAEFWLQEPTLAGVFSSFVDKVAALPWKVTGPKRTAEKTALMLHGAEGGQGYPYYIGMEALDYLSCDKGCFTEKGRQRARSTTGPVLGVQHIDATRMVYFQHATAVNKPNQWVYFPLDEEPVAIPDQNLLQIIPAPTGRDFYRRNGRCATSRLHDAAKLMIGYLTFHRQRIGDLPPELIAIINNMSQPQFEGAYTDFKTRRLQFMNKQHPGEAPIWPGILFLGNPNPAAPVSIELTRMTGVPDNFDMMSWAEWWVKQIALNVGQDVGEYWLIQHSGATKALASTQHLKGRGKGPGRFIYEHELRVNTEVIARTTRFEYDRKDDEQDAAKADIVATNIGSLATLADIGLNAPAPAAPPYPQFGAQETNQITHKATWEPPDDAEAAVAATDAEAEAEFAAQPTNGVEPMPPPPEPYFSREEIRKLAVEWNIISPELAGQAASQVLGVMIKSWLGGPPPGIDAEQIIIVDNNLITRPAPASLITHQATAEKMWQLAEKLTQAPVPLRLPPPTPPTRIFKGGPGSGFFGHAGRPGKEGGSVGGIGERVTGAVQAGVAPVRARVEGVYAKVDSWLTEHGIDKAKRKKIAKAAAIAGVTLAVAAGAVILYRRMGGTDTGVPTIPFNIAQRMEGIKAQLAGKVTQVRGSDVKLEGAFGAKLVRLENGVLAIEKGKIPRALGRWGDFSPWEGGKGMVGREAAYSTLANSMGFGRFVPQTAMAAGKSRQLFIDGAQSLPITSQLLNKGARQGFIMDRLFNSGDRHAANLLLKDNALQFIDNGISLSSSKDISPTPLDVFTGAHKVIRRAALNKSEMGHVQALWSARAPLTKELNKSIGVTATDRLWTRVGETVKTGKLPWHRAFGPAAPLPSLEEILRDLE